MKQIVYYTNHKCDESILLTARALLERTGLPIISVSHFPLSFGRNIVVDLKSSVLSMFKQQLIAVEHAAGDILFFCEHDNLYHSSHFEFTPTLTDTYYFNTNVWTVNSKTGDALWYDMPGHKGRKMTSGLVVYRDLITRHLEKKIKLVEKHGFSHRKIGYAPTKIDEHDTITYQSKCPNVDIKHGRNITRGRFSIDQFRSKDKIKDSWKISDYVPCWGKTKSRFEEFLKECYPS